MAVSQPTTRKLAGETAGSCLHSKGATLADMARSAALATADSGTLHKARRYYWPFICLGFRSNLP